MLRIALTSLMAAAPGEFAIDRRIAERASGKCQKVAGGIQNSACTVRATEMGQMPTELGRYSS